MQTNLSNFRKKYVTRKAEEWKDSPDDREWLTEIVCRKKPGGHIFTAGPYTLGYCSEPGEHHGHIKTKLESMPGVTISQDGDAEFIAVFAVDKLDCVAEVVGARKKRHLTDEQRIKLTNQIIAAKPPSHKSRVAQICVFGGGACRVTRGNSKTAKNGIS